MLRKLDTSPRLSRFLGWISPALAQQRGLPMLVGTVLVVTSFLCSGVIIIGLAMSDAMSAALLWLCIPTALLHTGIFIGFLGFMLATPLGESHRSIH